ncbi:MAG: hypothetical protein AB8B91_03585 [Rubripirellula sp.]
MRNRGIPHDAPVWNDAGNGGGSWTIHTNTELFGSVRVDVPAKTADPTLTDVQNRSLQMLRSLPKSLRPALLGALQSYAMRYLGDDYVPEDCDFLCDNASVPYLHESSSTYVFLNASSDVDEEHGVCFLIRNSGVIACCHGDESLQFYDWDATDELDSLGDNGG